MAFINTIGGTEDFVHLYVATANITLDTDLDLTFANVSTVVEIPALQEITVNATPGMFRWKQLDALSEYVVTTPSTNSISATLVLDPDTFYGAASLTSTGGDGIFDITNNKTLTAFRFYWSGNSEGDNYIQGVGYLSGLAATVTPDSPVWTSPVTVEVVGDYTSGVQT